jgi:hypothetical protein
VRIAFDGASSTSRVDGSDASDESSNYLTGSERSRWRLGVRRFRAISYRGIYPQTDLVFYSGTSGLEFDFAIAPGGTPSPIRMHFFGADAQVTADGDILLATAAGELLVRRPTCYQQEEGSRRVVPARFQKLGTNSVGLSVGSYDASAALIVDPELRFSTLVGGNTFDFGTSVTTDAASNIYLVGSTLSADFPTGGAIPGSYRGLTDCFVAKLSPDGSVLLYSTYLGGADFDAAVGVAVDSGGAAYVVGVTSSANDFPQAGGLGRGFGGGFNDGFVTKLNAAGDGIVFSTFLGGSGAESCDGIRLDDGGNIYIVGGTESPDFPTVNALQGALSGARCYEQACLDAFVAKLAPDGSSLVYSTYLGGNDYELARGIAVDADGFAYVGGNTRSDDFPVTPGAFRPNRTGEGDVFVSKITPSGSTLVFSTYLGGSQDDGIAGVAVDEEGGVFIAGDTQSPDFPIKEPFQAGYGGVYDGFIAKLDPQGSALAFSSFIGGSALEFALGLSVDTTGAVYALGITSSQDFPVIDAIQPTYGGGPNDLFVVKIEPALRSVRYSTYLGGTGADEAIGSAAFYTDFSGNAFVVGFTSSPDFPVTPGVVQSALAGATDVCVVKVVDRYNLQWDPPDTPTGEGAPPPRFFVVRRAGESDGNGGQQPVPSGGAQAPSTLMGYRVYRGNSQNFTLTPATLYASVPANQTTTGPVIPGGAFFVVTAVYSNGMESVPSNPSSGGFGEGQIDDVQLDGGKLVVMGQRFTEVVTVLLDGIPFSHSAVVRDGKMTIVQRGTLLTGMSVSQYIAAHQGTVLLTVRNSNGGIASFKISR